MSWLFTSGDQIIGASVSASVLPMNIQGQFPLGLTGLISVLSRASLVAQMVNNLPAMPETWVQSLGWEDPLEFVQSHIHWVSDAIYPSHPPPPLLLLPSIFPSMRVFPNVLTLHIRWPEYWSFSFSISPSSEYSGSISFRIDWFDLLAVQGTLKSLLQHHSSKASILQCSAFFMVQLSHLYMTPGKATALTIRTVIGKVISLFF